MRIDPRGARAGAYAETLVARAGDTRIRTLLGGYVEPPAHELTVDVTDRRGKPLDTLLFAHSQTEDFHEWLHAEDGHVTVRLPDPVTMRGKDRAVEIDARDGKPLTMTLDDPDAEKSGLPDFGVVHRRGRADFSYVGTWPVEAATVLPARVPGTTFLHHDTWYAKGLEDGETSPFLYKVVDRRVGGIPENPAYAAKRRDLAKVTTTYRATGQDQEGDAVIGLSLPGGYSGWGTANPLRFPTTVTEYFTLHPDLRWWRDVTNGPDVLQTRVPRSYRPGSHQEVWNAAVFGPALPRSCFDTLEGPAPTCAFRDGDTIGWIGAPTLATDGGGKGRGALGDSPGTATLRRGDTVVATCRLDDVDCLQAEVPAEPATYTLTVHANRGKRSGLSSRIVALYTFRSGHTESLEALPFLAVRHSPRGLDEHNQAEPGSTTKIPMWVEKYGDARVTSVTAEASTDGGKTWQPLRVRHHGRDWVTTVTNPDTGSVSLRTTAEDAEGNEVTQTIRDAYHVRTG